MRGGPGSDIPTHVLMQKPFLHSHVHIDVTRHTVKGLKFWWRLAPFNQGHIADLCNDHHVSSPSSHY